MEKIDIDKIFKALGDWNRLRIVKLLERKKMCVCELAFVLGIAQPSVSRHLKKLAQAGIVMSEQDGYWTNYYLKPSNPCVKTLIKNLSRWLTNGCVGLDQKKIKLANRIALCCK